MHGLIADLCAAAEALMACPECGGEGSISYNDSPNQDPQLEQSATCGKCHGEGYLEGGLPAWAYERIDPTGGDHRSRCVPIIEAWQEAIRSAFALYKGERARELRGDRKVGRFTEEGVHPFSLEWGRVLALEALLPGLSDCREKLKVDDQGEVTELFVSTRVLRLEAREAAEEEYRAEIIANHLEAPTDV